MNNLIINELLNKLKTNNFTDEQLDLVSKNLQHILLNYKVEKLTNELVIYSGLPKCYETYIATRMIEGLSKNSIKLYELRLRQFFQWVKKDINNITANDIRLFLYEYQEQRKISNRTLDSFRTIISTFFGWANAEGYCDRNPCLTVSKIKYVPKQKDALNELELELLRNACDDLREKTLIEFIYSTGARVSEVLNCKLNDIDFSNAEVTLFGKGSKYRIDYLNAKSIMYLKEYKNERTDDSPYLFVSKRGHRQLTKSGVESIIRKIWKRSGIEKKVTPHTIRHTTATLALKRGVPVEQVQKILGHENINTTMIYAEVMRESVKHSHSMAIV